MDKIELIQRIGSEVCEECGPHRKCIYAEDPSDCERIINAMDDLDEYIEVLLKPGAFR